MTTPVIAPESLPYPITIDQLIAPIGSTVKKGERLFAYKFWYIVEIASSPDEGNNNGSHTKKAVRESIEFFEAPFEGDLVGWEVDTGDEVAAASQVICEIRRPCNHDIVYGGLCTMCGKEVDETDQVEANLAMSHTDNNLKVSRKEAKDIEQSLKKRLRKAKKLVLVVDLDQTVIHCGVDPTIGEWKKDPSNPNYDTLKDVQMFALDEEPIVPPLYLGPRPPERKCWYFVKVRPGLKEFFEKVAPLYEMHIYTMATRAYALEIAKIIDPDGSLFGDRILSRDENGSLTQKSLERLFPTDQSMVIVIDDRGDVWKWCPNLIKVVPYNFFVGVGDINSNFLPRQQTGLLQLGRRTHKKPQESDELLTDIMDTEKKLQEKIDEEVKRQEEKLSPQLNAAEEAGQGKSKEQLTKKLEYSASLEVQQQNRPLAALQKHMHNQRLLVDDDDELYYLKDTLAKIHEEYYKLLDSGDSEDADIQRLVPVLKSKVFGDCHFVFSGLIPLGTDIKRADIVLWTGMFGATTSSEVDENTTHVITKTPGTYKARIAKGYKDSIKVVHPDWVFECLVTWKHADEKPYELIIQDPATEEEIEDFKRKMEQRHLIEQQQRDQLSTDALEKSAQGNALELFASGISWLSDDEDEISDDDDDEEEKDSDNDRGENEDANDHEKEEKENGGQEVSHAKTEAQKRPLPSDQDMSKEQPPSKKTHIDESKGASDEESASDFEEELLNALDG
ncbi:FCP1 (YMR277W) [Zygosaccharomyces parabailii]|nr:FCP1 (YMR277W) [Zygosaccharomyces parabailii]CDH13692.1 probable RNA polymerase II subunit A C-terminal domain phosphatase [Zygosaccharomyces bailii ISA1307]